MNISKRFGFLFIAGFLVLMNQALADCENANTTVEAKNCAWEEYQKADKQLNKTYQALVKELDPPGKKLLVSGETAWIKFRDNNCDFEADYNRGGTMMGLTYTRCLQRLTTQRTQDLQTQIDKRHD